MTRKIPALIVLLYLMIMSVSCGGRKSTKLNEAPESAAVITTVDLSIEGMTCTGCENTICTSLEKIPGVKSVTASHTDGKATIEFEQGKVDTATLKEAVDAAGYKALKVTTGTDQ
jgi:copper chaperone CopZ